VKESARRMPTSELEVHTLAEVAAALGVSDRQVYALIAMPGGLRAIRYGKKSFRVTHAELRRFAQVGLQDVTAASGTGTKTMKLPGRRR
jgi:excisionase family DNA binding protein